MFANTVYYILYNYVGVCVYKPRLRRHSSWWCKPMSYQLLGMSIALKIQYRAIWPLWGNLIILLTVWNLFVIVADVLCVSLLLQNQSLKASLESNVNVELYNALHYHMIDKRLLTKDLKNEMTVKSMYKSNKLLINHYSNGVCIVCMS